MTDKLYLLAAGRCYSVVTSDEDVADADDLDECNLRADPSGLPVAEFGEPEVSRWRSLMALEEMTR